VRTTFLDGRVAPTIEAHAADHRPDLIIMTTHGRGGLSRLWLGSVADTLVRRAGVPVLLVRGEEAPGGDAEVPVFRHVLVPLDGSPRAETVLDHAVRLGAPDATTYTLLTVVAPRLIAVRSYPGMRTPPVDQEDLESRVSEAQAYLDHVAGELRRSGATVATRVVVNLQAASGILDAAAAESADLIALATHGRGAITRFVLGSVADKVVRGAETSVLALRPADVEPASAPPSSGASRDG
jgi:nucleotide-binding universal stress UspA family protein